MPPIFNLGGIKFFTNVKNFYFEVFRSVENKVFDAGILTMFKLDNLQNSSKMLKQRDVRVYKV